MDTKSAEAAFGTFQHRSRPILASLSRWYYLRRRRRARPRLRADEPSQRSRVPYRLNTSVEDARRLLLVYLERINELADRAEFYHLLTNSCTINIVRYANAAGRSGRFDIDISSTG